MPWADDEAEPYSVVLLKGEVPYTDLIARHRRVWHMMGLRGSGCCRFSCSLVLLLLASSSASSSRIAPYFRSFFSSSGKPTKGPKKPKLSQTLNPRPIVIVEVLDSPTLPKLESSSVEALRVPGGWYLAQRSLAPCVGLLCPSEAQVWRRGTSEQES